MPHLISNLYEKAYTPYTAKLAPRHLWSKPQLGKPLTILSHFKILMPKNPYLTCSDFRQKAHEDH